MLERLHIQNIAVIESAEIEFSGGFNVLTGETGAGKSIIIDALSALSGQRTSRELIREGALSAYVGGIFSKLSGDVRRTLSEFGFSPEEDGTVFISREITQEGKNTCRVGSRPAPLSVLRELGPMLVSIHGQHMGQTLLDDTAYLPMVDRAAKTADLLLEYGKTYHEMKRLKTEIAGFSMNEEEKARRLDALRYETEEIESADLREGEEEELNARRAVLQNGTRVVAAFLSALQALSDEDGGGATDLLARAADSFSGIALLDTAFSDLSERLADLRYRAEDLSADLARAQDGLEFSPEELEEIESRLNTLYKLKRKYGAGVSEILAYYDKIILERESIELSDEKIVALSAALHEQHGRAVKLACELSELRRAAAEGLSKAITAELRGLEMKSAVFSVQVDQNGQDGVPELSESGGDMVSFLISTNAGESPKPLAKVASGGELSRIMLSLQSVLSSETAAATLVFDEIDAGISGRAADSVGERLYRVSNGAQVLCVTHLAQIAALADRHFIIEKGERDGRTYTHVCAVSGKEQAHELARIIAGRSVTDAAVRAAEEMLASASTRKGRKEKDEDL